VKRTQIYVGTVVVICLAAIALRVWSERSRAPVLTTQASSAHLEKPHDYVAHPWVVAEENDRGPKRLISLAPSITEVICALGLRDRLVGRTQYCTYPPEVAEIRTVGALTDTNYELIKSLKPDIVFVTENSTEVIKNLEALSIRCEPIPHNTLEEVYTSIVRVGDLCDRPKTARALVGAIWADMDALHRKAIQMKQPPLRVLVTLSSLPVPAERVFAAGPGSFFESLLLLTGHTNAAREVLKVGYGEIPLEKLVSLDPDVILEFRADPTPEQMTDLYRSWSEVGNLKAIQQQRVRSLGGPEWLSAGPRIAIELHQFITVLSDLH
jgi:iron complex transport system substrate-binding protein